jgi:hypothetical protein
MDFDHPTFRFIKLANQRNVLTGIWSSPTWGPDPELIDMVGDLDLEDYEKAKTGEIQLPPRMVKDHEACRCTVQIQGREAGYSCWRLGDREAYEQHGEKMRPAMNVLGVECPHATEKLDTEFIVVGMAQFWLKLKIEKWQSLVTMHF